jgi:beta-N-acetylhexosaminidase
VRDPAAVRRRRALAATALVAAIAGAAVGAGNSDGDGATLPNLPNRQLAGERVITAFAGSHPPASVRRMIHSGAIAGVILFAGNLDSVAGPRRLTRELQSIKRPRSLRAPLLVMVDQEGGLVKRLPGPPSGSAAAMGRRGTAYCRRQGRATGRLLRRAGVNVDLAPVLDVARAGSAIGAEHRAFGREPGVVSHRGNGFAAGLASRGVAATGKHFPGLGAASENTDSAVQRIDLETSRLRAVDERPYRRLVAADGPMVMLSTAIYPRLSRLPAALARPIATAELRDRLGFRGVSITDALETASARAVGGAAKLARLGARAGTDLLLYTSPADARAAGRELTGDLRAGRVDRGAFRASAARVLALRASLR